MNIRFLISHTDWASFLSHIQHHLLPLLDVNLYISSLNYPLTRKAWTQTLAFPSQYHFVLFRRTLAHQRTAHLNLAALNLDAPKEETDNSAKQTSVLPEHLRSIIKPSVSSLLKKTAASDRFRLDALIDAALEPLSELLGDKSWFLSNDEPSTLDALALGYLSLAMVPDLPSSWLREGIETKYPKLKDFVERGIKDTYGGATSVEDALEPQNTSKLPWRASKPVTVGQRVTSTMTAIWEGLPLPQIRSDEPKTAPPGTSAQGQAATSSIPFIAATATMTAIAAAAAAYYYGYPQIFNAPAEKNINDFGEAGTLLSSMDFGFADPPSGNVNASQAQRVGPGQARGGRLDVTGVEVESELD